VLALTSVGSAPRESLRSSWNLPSRALWIRTGTGATLRYRRGLSDSSALVGGLVFGTAPPPLSPAQPFPFLDYIDALHLCLRSRRWTLVPAGAVARRSAARTCSRPSWPPTRFRRALARNEVESSASAVEPLLQRTRCEPGSPPCPARAILGHDRHSAAVGKQASQSPLTRRLPGTNCGPLVGPRSGPAQSCSCGNGALPHGWRWPGSQRAEGPAPAPRRSSLRDALAVSSEATSHRQSRPSRTPFSAPGVARGCRGGSVRPGPSTG
jgi:hypothetical protein